MNNIEPRNVLWNWFRHFFPKHINNLTSIVFFISCLLITASAWGDLWLDEVWSISYAFNATSAISIFNIHHDNNHPLNTIFLYFLGPQKTFFMYRLFSVLSGIGSIKLVGYIAKKKWGEQEALCSTLLVGNSFPLILLFSEARGYASAIFFTLICYILLTQNLNKFSLIKALLFVTSWILALLSHSTFIIAGITFLVWDLVEQFYKVGNKSQKIFSLIAHHFFPIVFFVWWYFFFLRDLVVGGGIVFETVTVLGQAAIFLMGFPKGTTFAILAGVCLLVLVTIGIKKLHSEEKKEWIFFLLILTVSPFLLLGLANNKVLYYRYFLVCFPFFYLLISYVVCKYFKGSFNYQQLLIGIVLVIFIIGQTQRNYLLIKFGRGNYSSALGDIIKNSPQGFVYVGTDQDFRNKLLFDFYTYFFLEGNNLYYVEQPNWHKQPPDWLITSSVEPFYKPEKTLFLDGVGEFYLTGEYKFSGGSGWSWFLFRRKK